MIIPVFNVDPYLEQCLASVAGQNLDGDCFEVLVIDDASTDSSLRIARSFESRHPNFKVVALPENTRGGSGIPSNIGIRMAKGEYVGFVDGDDWIEPDMFSSMLAKARKENADLVVCDFMEFDQVSREVFLSYDKVLFDRVADPAFAHSSLPDQKKALLKLSPVPWRKIYRRSFMTGEQVLFPEGEEFFEDNPLHWFSIIPARKIAVIPEAMVTHRKNRAGQTMCSDGSRFLDFITHASKIRAYLEERECYDEFRLEFLNWLINQCLWILPNLDGSVSSRFIRGMEPLFHDFSRSEMVGYFRIYPWKALVMNGLLYVIRGRYFLYSQLNFSLFRLLSNILAVYYFFGWKRGSGVIRRRRLQGLFSPESG